MQNGKRMRHSKWQKLDWAIDIKDQMWKCAEMNLHTGMTLAYTKAELLQKSIFFLIHLFARDVLVMKKLEIEKNRAHIYYIGFKS